MATTCELLRVNVERGPNWLFIKLHPSKKSGYETLADQLWAVIECHFTYRVVMELDEFNTLPAAMIEQLGELRDRVAERGGWLRLCGLSEKSQAALESQQSSDSLRNHNCREDAVMGSGTHAAMSAPHFEFAAVGARK